MRTAREKTEKPAAPAGGPAWRLGDPVRLETGRLVIRSLTPDDVSERFVSWFADLETMRYLSFPLRMPRRQVLDDVRRADNAAVFMLGIFWKETGEHIGFSRVTVDLRPRIGTTITVVERAFWGRGIATEARRAIVDFLFGTMNLHKITNRMFGPNAASERVSDKLGFTHEGTLRKQALGHAGERYDIHLISLLREDWEAQRGAPAGPGPGASPRERERAKQARWLLLPDVLGYDRFDRLLDNEFLSEDDSRARADAALAGVVRAAAERVPYYRDLFARFGVSPGDIAGAADLPRLPVLTRADLQRAGRALMARDLARREQGIITRSSGTTGAPTEVFQPVRAARFFGLLKQRECRWFGFDPRGKLAIIRKTSELIPRAERRGLWDGDTVRLAHWPYLGAYFVTGPMAGIGVATPGERQLAWLADERPDYLLSRPSNLEHLAFALAGRPPPGSLRGLQAISEEITPAMRRRIESAFGVPVHENYGLNEIGIVASRCPEGGRFHVHAEHCLVEIVDADGNPCPPSTRGRLLVTALMNPVMPLIRYDTGDTAEVPAGPCPCGRTLPSFAAVGGRSRRFAFCPPGTLERVDAIEAAVEELPAELTARIRRYRLHQFRDGAFELRVAAAGALPDGLRKAVERRWESCAGPPAPLAVVEVDDSALRTEDKFQKFTSDFIPARESHSAPPGGDET